MNLKGIATSQKDEKWFWEVCGTISLAIFVAATLYAVKHRLKITSSRRPVIPLTTQLV